MNKFLFIIPLKARESASDWEMTQRLLDRTLMSIEGQSNPDHHTFIVCNERPNVTVNLEKTTFISTDIKVDGIYNQHKGRIDKQKKVYLGLLEAKELCPERVMILDGDDLIHRGLVSFVKKNSKYQGFVLNRGYRYILGQSYLTKSIFFHQMSASSVVFPFVPTDFPKDATVEDYASFYMTKKSHIKNIENEFARLEIPFRRIPFYAAIYTRGYGDSLRDVGIGMVEDPVPGKRKINLKYLRGLTQKALGRLLGSPALNEHLKRKFPGLDKEIV